MPQEIEDLFALLPCRDVDPGTAGRIRGAAHARFGRPVTALARVYGLVLEPVLVLATILASLTWALERIHFIR